MKTQHTPGPWKAEPNGGDDSDGTRKFICVYDRHGYSDTLAETYNADSHEQTEANARLIAAAPELGDLARNVAGLDSHVLETQSATFLRDVIREWQRDARAAIAKAEGEGAPCP